MKGFFFDMDGVLFDSMPNHAESWAMVAKRHNLKFTARECYLQEGRTGYDMIREVLLRTNSDKQVSDEEVDAIYEEKTRLFVELGGAVPMHGVLPVLQMIQAHPDTQIWVVTGSGQKSLLERLNRAYPGIFAPERMITAFDVRYGKPRPDPYLRAWERCGLKKEECCVIENAPLGCQSAKAAGLFTIVVNTGPLLYEDFEAAEPDAFLPDMKALLEYLPKLLN